MMFILRKFVKRSSSMTLLFLFIAVNCIVISPSAPQQLVGVLQPTVGQPFVDLSSSAALSTAEPYKVYGATSCSISADEKFAVCASVVNRAVKYALSPFAFSALTPDEGECVLNSCALYEPSDTAGQKIARVLCVVSEAYECGVRLYNYGSMEKEFNVYMAASAVGPNAHVIVDRVNDFAYVSNYLTTPVVSRIVLIGGGSLPIITQTLTTFGSDDKLPAALVLIGSNIYVHLSFSNPLSSRLAKIKLSGTTATPTMTYDSTVTFASGEYGGIYENLVYDNNYIYDLTELGIIVRCTYQNNNFARLDSLSTGFVSTLCMTMSPDLSFLVMTADTNGVVYVSTSDFSVQSRALLKKPPSARVSAVNFGLFVAASGPPIVLSTRRVYVFNTYVDNDYINTTFSFWVQSFDAANISSSQLYAGLKPVSPSITLASVIAPIQCTRTATEAYGICAGSNVNTPVKFALSPFAYTAQGPTGECCVYSCDIYETSSESTSRVICARGSYSGGAGFYMMSDLSAGATVGLDYLGTYPRIAVDSANAVAFVSTQDSTAPTVYKIINIGGTAPTSTTSAKPSGAPAAMLVIGNYLFVHSASAPAALIMYRSSDMNFISTVEFNAGESGSIYDNLANDANFVYDLTENGIIVKISYSPTSLARVDSLNVGYVESFSLTITPNHGLLLGTSSGSSLIFVVNISTFRLVRPEFVNNWVVPGAQGRPIIMSDNITVYGFSKDLATVFPFYLLDPSPRVTTTTTTTTSVTSTTTTSPTTSTTTTKATTTTSTATTTSAASTSTTSSPRTTTTMTTTTTIPPPPPIATESTTSSSIQPTETTPATSSSATSATPSNQPTTSIISPETTTSASNGVPTTTSSTSSLVRSSTTTTSAKTPTTATNFSAPPTTSSHHPTTSTYFNGTTDVNITFNITTPPPTMSPFMQQLHSATVAATTATSFTSVLAGSPAGATQGVRTRDVLTSVSEIANGKCGHEHDEGIIEERPDPSASPLQLHFESGNGGYAVGTVVGDFILLVGIWIVCFSTYFFLYRPIKKWWTERKKQKRRDEKVRKQQQKQKQQLQNKKKSNKNGAVSQNDEEELQELSTSDDEDNESQKLTFRDHLAKSKSLYPMVMISTMFVEPMVADTASILQAHSVSVGWKILCSVITFGLFLGCFWGGMFYTLLFHRRRCEYFKKVAIVDEKTDKPKQIDAAPNKNSKRNQSKKSHDDNDNNNNNNNDSIKSTLLQFFSPFIRIFHFLMSPVGNWKCPKVGQRVAVQVTTFRKKSDVEQDEEETQPDNSRSFLKQSKTKNNSNNAKSGSNYFTVEKNDVAMFNLAVFLFEPYTNHFPRYIAMEILISVSISCCNIIGTLVQNCIGQGTLLLLVLCVHTSVTLYYRPHQERLLRWCVPTLGLSQICLVATALSGLAEQETLSEFGLSVSIFQLAVTILSMLAFFQPVVHELGWCESEEEKKKNKASKNNKKKDKMNPHAESDDENEMLLLGDQRKKGRSHHDDEAKKSRKSRPSSQNHLEDNDDDVEHVTNKNINNKHSEKRSSNNTTTKQRQSSKSRRDNNKPQNGSNHSGNDEKTSPPQRHSSRNNKQKRSQTLADFFASIATENNNNIQRTSTATSPREQNASLVDNNNNNNSSSLDMLLETGWLAPQKPFSGNKVHEMKQTIMFNNTKF